MLKHIALVIYYEQNGLTNDDQLLATILTERGYVVNAISWDDPQVDWQKFDMIILRSCWDYHLRPAMFHEWVRSLKARSLPLWNPPALVEWNMEKSYLQDLVNQGVSVIETEWFPKGRTFGNTIFTALLTQKNWHEVIIKPTISASSYQTFKVDRSTFSKYEAEISRLARGQNFMIQEFRKEVVEEGEWSLIFFKGEFSHGVLKCPQKGDFRSQSEFGGKIVSTAPHAKLIGEARQVISKIPYDWLYVRVDGIDTVDGFKLMELELIEPFLFLGNSPAGAENFALAIEKLLN